MKGILLTICAVVCVVLVCRAQENQAIKQALEEKYGIGVVKYKDSNGGWYEISKDYKRGACDSLGKEIIPPIYDELDKKKYCFVFRKNGKEGIISKFGVKQIETETNVYIDEYDDKNNKGCFIGILNSNDLKNAQLGLFDENGEMLVPCEHKYIHKMSPGNGIFLIAKGGVCKSIMGFYAYPFDAKYALYDIKKKKYITEFKYDYISYGAEEEKLNRFNIGGKVTANTLYYDATVEGGKWGFLDDEGKEIIPAKYTSVTEFHDGVAQVTENGITSLIPNPLFGGMIYTRTEQAVALDTQIPEVKKNNEESFVFILVNENYSHFSGADYSINDGKIFAEYCKKTLGLSENNVRYYEDATYGNMLKAIKQIQDIADVYDGEAKIIFYFSGLGMSDEKDGKKYILPSDASVSALSSTALPLDDLLGELNKLNTNYTMVVVDAPFNGMDKNGKALTTGRGVKISNRNDEEVSGNMVLLIGNENGNNYSSKNLGHGLLTYSLLNQLKQTKGECSVGPLLEAITTDIKRESLSLFKEVQKPLIKASEQIKGKLQILKL